MVVVAATQKVFVGGLPHNNHCTLLNNKYCVVSVDNTYLLIAHKDQRCSLGFVIHVVNNACPLAITFSTSAAAFTFGR